MRMREELQRAAGKVRRLDATELPTPRGNRGGKKVGTEASRALQRSQTFKTQWRGCGEGAYDDLRPAAD